MAADPMILHKYLLVEYTPRRARSGPAWFPL